ncbi:FAD-containing oxidoreductase [Labrys okinawensis]|uniref:FAD-containing oxidoreductase n=1 Tax=Labrys okinawensis TaxID=346911 RepID=A0A2S9QDN1_9HYPH|nr:FAD-containing oxidoreductase [Labrys okinawensis]PRH87435.1 FAD-containing oxidoreductase [Labrys okinawensis]
MSSSFDAIIIGAGQAGPSLAGRFSAAGQRVAVIERKHVGGTCVNTGCMPTKTLVASAYAAHLARRADDYGVVLGSGIGVDMKKVWARKQAVTMNARTGLEDWLGGMPDCRLIRGHARFAGPHEIEVDGERLSAPKIFLNVGGRALVPDMPGLAGIDYLTNTSIVELDTLPEHLIVVGGSYIALEFAQMYRRFGSEVTVIERGPRLTSREDPDISDAIRDILIKEGIDIHLGATNLSFAREDRGVAVTVAGEGQSPARISGSHVLIAVGRVPNTDDLGLDRAGVHTDARGYVTVDDQLRSNVEGIWALGDCNGKGAFTHTSYNDYEIVAANLFDADPRRVSDRITAYALYIDPPLGRIGQTEEEVRRSGRKALIGKRPMTRVGRAVEKGETQGFMKVIVDADSHAILGAAILGVGGDEVVHGLLDGMYAKAPYATIQRAVHIHPTVSELVPTMIGEMQPLV